MSLEDIKNLDKKESTPEPPKEKTAVYAENRRSLDDMRTELEMKKIQMEIAKLERPDTSLDYWGKMLEITNQNHAQQMKMMEMMYSQKLELEKLKLSSDGDGDYLITFVEMLKPYIPQIINKMNNSQPAQGYDTSQPSPTGVYTSPQPSTVVTENKNGELRNTELAVPVEPSPTTQEMNIEAYKERIRKGEVDFETAYEDFQRELPDYALQITKEQFRTQFNRIKDGKA